MSSIVRRAISPNRAALAAIALMLGGCAKGTVQDALGMGKRSPDEFAVVSRAPLVLPPDYGLRPPDPGSIDSPFVRSTKQQARANLVGTAEPVEPDDGAREVLVAGVGAADDPILSPSDGESALLAEITSTPSDPDIRRKIAEENQNLAQVEGELFTRLVKWRDPATLGATVDPGAETERLRENRRAGKPPTEGDSPVIVQRRQSVIQGMIQEVF